MNNQGRKPRRKSKKKLLRQVPGRDRNRKKAGDKWGACVQGHQWKKIGKKKKKPRGTPPQKRRRAFSSTRGKAAGGEGGSKKTKRPTM